MKQVLEFLAGKKTFILACIAGIYGAGIEANLWQHQAAIDVILAGLGTATMRAAIGKIENANPKQ